MKTDTHVYLRFTPADWQCPWTGKYIGDKAWGRYRDWALRIHGFNTRAHMDCRASVPGYELVYSQRVP